MKNTTTLKQSFLSNCMSIVKKKAGIRSGTSRLAAHSSLITKGLKMGLTQRDIALALYRAKDSPVRGLSLSTVQQYVHETVRDLKLSTFSV
jgi:hypothetical protein